jgi:bifunctional non-homologous end joining protein LigD
MAADGKLSSYRAKRDFSQTSEPSGEEAVAPSEIRRFIIQKHAASHLHYDFRLEIDGVLKSWAVTKGPSIDPKDKRLAVEVEDHPLDYGDFEGTIPKGQYGGGTVQLWDRGFWLPEASDPAAAIRNGELKFVVEGARLHGGFVLVRIRNRRPEDKKNNWLLIKHRDEFAREDDGDRLLSLDRSVASGRTMAEIAAGRGPGPTPFFLAGKTRAAPDAVWNSNRVDNREARSDSPIAIARPQNLDNFSNEAVLGTAEPMPQFIPPELCRLVERPPSGAGWVHEVKFDGYRIQARVEDGRVVLRTRKSLNWTSRFASIARAAANLPSGIYDGEIVALNKNGVPDLGALQAALAEGKTDRLSYFVFDLMFALNRNLLNLPLRDRKAALKHNVDHLGNNSVIRYVEYFDAPGESVLETARNMLLEGIVSKHLDDIYRPGQREWCKIKCRPRQEVVLGGWASEGSRFRSLLAGMYRNNHLVYVGRIGTGFSEDVVRQILPRLKECTIDKSPFQGRNAPRYRAGVNWLKPELVAQIEFAGWTTDGNIRAAAFKALREDMSAADVIAGDSEEPAEEFTQGVFKDKSNASTTPPAKAGSSANVLGITISNPEKAMWPDAGDGIPVTKLDLALYYELVGEWVISYIKGRPCSILRAPDGIDGQRFFQRHALPGMSKFLKTTKISGEREPYIQIDTIEALIAVAQVAALELHPWNCMPDQPEIPGRLVFDLDPDPNLEFGAVIHAAQELRDRLGTLGLISFCKTTGGKGLHVVTPIWQEKNEEIDWQIAKTFAEAVVTQMAADSPRRYLTTMAKKDRSGRIYLDYLRNDRTSTAVSLLSTRARPGAPVSMPIDWPEVRAGLEPLRFTLRTAPRLLAKKVWQGYDEAPRPLKEAIKRLTKSAG